MQVYIVKIRNVQYNSFIMKKLILTMLLAACLVSCDWLLDDPEKDASEGEQFYAQNFTTDTPYTLKAKKLAEGKKCVIWAENGSGVTEAKAKEIATEYDDNIRPKIVDAFGMKNFTVKDGTSLHQFDDILDFANWLAGKNNKKLTILLLDIKDNFNKDTNPAYVAGYFYSGNFYPKSDIPSSNERDMIYVDTYPSLDSNLVKQEQTFATFAHELQHLINFSTTLLMRRENSKGEVSLMDTWIDEGLSSQAEQIYLGKNLEDRCRQFNKDEKGTIAKGNNFFVWGNNPDAILDEYSTVYLFFRWLYLQANSGLQATIFKDIETAKKSDHTIITDVAEGINSAWNDWETLLRSWLAANYYPENTDYGYKDSYFNTGNNKITVKPLATITSTPLYPGEGVYSRNSSSYTTPSSSGNIRYAGLPGSSSAIVTAGSFNSGVLLTFNASTNSDNKTAKQETGTLTGVAASVSSIGSGTAGSRMVIEDAQTETPIGPYRIDARDYSRIFGRNR